MHEPRGKTSLAVGYAISPTGADHMEAIHDPSFEAFGTFDEGFETLGMLEPVDRLELNGKKVRAFFVAQHGKAPGLVVRDPILNAVAEAFRNNVGILDKGVGGGAVGPTTVVL